MVQAAAPLLNDPVRAVRIETARVLAGVDQRSLTHEQQTAFAAAILEFERLAAALSSGPERAFGINASRSRPGKPVAYRIAWPRVHGQTSSMAATNALLASAE